MRGFASIALFALACTGAFAQPGDTSPTFEAASIKPFPEGTPLNWSGCQGGPGSSDPGHIECRYATLKLLVMQAYHVKSQEVFGPAWMETEHFNLMAKLPQGATRAQVSAMYQNLLADRFKVVVHREKRLLPAYSLTVAKGGLKIKESVPLPPDDTAPSGPPPKDEDGFPILRPSQYNGGCITLYRNGRARMLGGNVTMASLADTFNGQLDRVVVDETGLAAKYDIRVTWTPDSTQPGGTARPASPEASMPQADLFVAIEQQLGLKLAPKKVEREALVIDRAEKVPTEN